IPENSLIGLLFSISGSCQTVRSHFAGMAQHDPLSWVIRDGQLAAHTGIARKAYLRAQRVNRLIRSIPYTQRKNFVADSYELVTATDAGDIYTLMEHPLQSMRTMGRTIRHWEKGRRKNYRKIFRKLQQAI
ncbi:MAG: DUF2974 domain-containing protein, partial [Lachnospiraceae bacterium]|nr:DUF2974 domain-containing protein [Lachnospiraceae bacterium]